MPLAMRKLFCFFLLLFLSGNSLFAQSWERMQSWGLDLQAIYWINSETGIAAGENLLIRTQDGGITWDEIQTPEFNRIQAIDFWNENQGIALGNQGTLIKTNDGGKSWEALGNLVPSTYYDLKFISENNLLIVAEGGKILHSKDQGENWTQISSGITNDLRSISVFSEQLMYIAGDNGSILKSEDEGTSWEKLSTGTSAHFNSLAFSSEEIGYAVGANGIIIKTEDGGENWAALNSTVNSELTSIAISPTNPALVTVVGKEAVALRSTNSGSSFGKANLGNGNSRDVYDLNFSPNQNVVFAVGKDGYLIRSNNAGSTWSTLLAGIRSNFREAEFKSDARGFIGGEKGSFYITTNGARTVVNRSLPVEMDIKGMDFWNTSFGYATGSNGQIFRTGNAGSAWVSVPAQTPETITGMYLFAPSVLYVTGTNGYIARSFDSGETWDSDIVTNTNENLDDVTYYDFQVGFAMGDNGQISWTNGGNTWENLPKLTERNLNALAKLDSNTAVIVGNKGAILKSEDKAQTWKAINTPFDTDLLDVDFWNELLGMAVGKGGHIILTKDGGENWFKLNSGTTRDLYGVSMGNSLVAFTVGDDGTILKYDCVPPSGISEISGNENVCLGESTYSIIDDSNEGSQIVWRVDGGEIISGQGTQTIQVNWTKEGRQGVFVSRQNFCGNGETSALEVLVSQIPSSDLEINGQGSVCKDQQSTYTIESEMATDYTWSIEGGEIISGQGTAEIEVLWAEEGETALSVILANSCGQSSEIVMPVLVSSPPMQPSPIIGEAQVGLGEYFYEVEEISEVDYQWEIGDGGRIISGQGSSKIQVEWLAEGDFSISVTPQNQCNDGESREIAVNVNIITGLEPAADINLKIFPNPSQGSITISSENLSHYQEINLVNALGQEVMQKTILEGQREVNFTEMPKGLWMVVLKGKEGIQIRKVIVK